MKNMFKCCLNPKVLAGIGLLVILLYVFAPQLARYSGLLVFLICPLSMLLMMAGMNHAGKSGTCDTKEKGKEKGDDEKQKS